MSTLFAYIILEESPDFCDWYCSVEAVDYLWFLILILHPGFHVSYCFVKRIILHCMSIIAYFLFHLVNQILVYVHLIFDGHYHLSYLIVPTYILTNKWVVIILLTNVCVSHLFVFPICISKKFSVSWIMVFWLISWPIMCTVFNISYMPCLDQRQWWDCW